MVDDAGPWNDFEIVDGHAKDDIVGIRRKGQQELCLSMYDFARLPNYLVDGKNLEVLPAMVQHEEVIEE